jgi:hypothetical protein
MLRSCLPKEMEAVAVSNQILVQHKLSLSVGKNPFEALFGCHPRVLGIDPEPTAVGNMNVWLAERSRMNQLIRQHLLRAQDRMKKQADKKRFEHSFSVGDLVYMKLQPYIQSSVVHMANQKLGFKYFGPFLIL